MTLWKNTVGFRRLTDSLRQPEILVHLPHLLAEVGVVQEVELQRVVGVVLHRLLHLPVVAVALLLHHVVAPHLPLDEGAVEEAMFLLPLHLLQ